MKKNLVFKILYILTAIIQVAIIAGVFIVQYLTKKKAGVLHHVYYRKYQFENSFFSPQNISIQKVIVIALIVLLMLIAIYVLKRKKNTFYKVQTFIGLLLSILLFVVITSSYFISKVAYHYFIMAFALVLLIQIVMIIGCSLYSKR